MRGRQDTRVGTAYSRGLSAEDSFKKLLGGRIIDASRQEDIEDHFDFSVRFDVKKIRSTDENGDADFIWAEVVNVRGLTGSLYGKSDFLAFELKTSWLVIPTPDLKAFVEANLVDQEVVFKKEPYRLYRRHGRLDKVVMLPVKDVLHLGFLVLKQPS